MNGTGTFRKLAHIIPRSGWPGGLGAPHQVSAGREFAVATVSDSGASVGVSRPSERAAVENVRIQNSYDLQAYRYYHQ